MAKVTVTLDGFEKVRAAVAAVPAAARLHLSNAVAATTVAVRQRAIASAPRGEGILKASIRAKTPSRNSLTGRVEVDSSAFYWRFVEYGTRHVAARPFIRQSAEMESAAFAERVRRVGQTLERDFSAGRFV